MSDIHRRRTDVDDLSGINDETVLPQTNEADPIQARFLALLNQHVLKAKENADLKAENEELRAEAARLYKLAYFDELTGLPNRRLLKESFESAVASGDPVVVLCIDLNKFKPINDTYGHKAGDDALKLVANALFSLTRKTDIISQLPSRHGGDEFVILLAGATLEELSGKLDEIRTAFSTFVMNIGSTKVPIGASIGAYERKENETLEQCLAAADIAMYKEKASSRARIMPYARQLEGYLPMPSSVPNVQAYALPAPSPK